MTAPTAHQGQRRNQSSSKSKLPTVPFAGVLPVQENQAAVPAVERGAEFLAPHCLEGNGRMAASISEHRENGAGPRFAQDASTPRAASLNLPASLTRCHPRRGEGLDFFNMRNEVT